MPDPAKPTLQLLIPDAALHDAVMEQLAIAGFEAASLKSGDGITASLLIVDEAAFDKKIQKVLAAPEAANTYVLLLGAGGDAPASETFPKPLRLGHLVARVRFYLEVAPRLRAMPLAFGPYRLEPQNRRLVTAAGDSVRLTEKETALLEYLGHRNAPVPREELLAAIWGYDGRIDTHTLETHIYQLRQKLDAEGKGAGLLVNEAGAYRLNLLGAA